MTARPLRKIFRYRDQAGATLEEHTEHWRTFTWEAGPVCVIHKGAPWGVPQVWASSIEEGKRVIRHAGVIAGSLNPRYGKTGTMAVKILRGGYLSVTKRDGPDGLPQVAGFDP